MKQYIATWTLTLNAVDAEQAIQMAQETMAAGDITLEIEEVEEGEEIPL